MTKTPKNEDKKEQMKHENNDVPNKDTEAKKEEQPQRKLEDFSIEELRQLVAFQKQLQDALMKENEELIKEKEKMEKNSEDLRKVIGKSDKYLDQLVALKSDFDSYKQRIRSDADLSRDEGRIQTIEKVLPFIDTLEKARVDITDGKAFELIYRQFTKILFEMGVEEIEVLGLPFNPNTANAITNREVEESKKGTVVEVYQKGYKFKERVLRYAQVIVGN